MAQQRNARLTIQGRLTLARRTWQGRPIAHVADESGWGFRVRSHTAGRRASRRKARLVCMTGSRSCSGVRIGPRSGWSAGWSGCPGSKSGVLRVSRRTLGCRCRSCTDRPLQRVASVIRRSSVAMLTRTRPTARCLDFNDRRQPAHRQGRASLRTSRAG